MRNTLSNNISNVSILSKVSSILADTLTVTDSSGTLIADYNWIGSSKENNKPPETLSIDLSGTDTEGQTKTITVKWLRNSSHAVDNPLLIPVRASTLQNGSPVNLTGIVAASHVETAGIVTSTYSYIFVADDIAKYIRFEFTPKVSATNTLNPTGSVFTSDFSGLVASAFSPAVRAGGTANISMRAAGVPADWNEATTPSITNEGTSGDITVGVAKPVWNAIDKQFEFDGTQNLIVPKGTLTEVVEVWIKGKFDTDAVMNMLGFTTNVELRKSATNFRINGLNVAPKSLLEHVFRIRWDGVNSFLSLDNGTPNTFNSGALTFGSGDLRIGSKNDNTSLLIGKVKELHVYNFALTGQDEIDMNNYFGI